MTFKKDLMNLARRYTNCEIQHNKMPCLTCFFALCKKEKIGIDTSIRLWQSLLVIRGDYTEKQFKR